MAHGIAVTENNKAVQPLASIATGIIGIVGTADNADTSTYPLNTPVVITKKSQVADLKDTGTLVPAMNAIFAQTSPIVIVVRVAHSSTAATLTSNVIGEVKSDGTRTGLQALIAAENKTNYKPRILGAPGHSDILAIQNALSDAADELRGFAYVDLTGDAVNNAVTERAKLNKRRLMAFYPQGKQGSDNVPLSAYALGMRAKIDAETGWHKTVSNVPVKGVDDITKDLSFDITKPTSDVGILNGKDISTIIRTGGSFRLWGNRTTVDTANGGDPNYVFESAVRTTDILIDTMVESHLWAMDKPMTNNLIDAILENINAKFRDLVNLGYVLGARAYQDPDLNTVTNLKAGKLYINYEFTPVPPLESLNFTSTITDTYLVQLQPQTP